MDLDAFVLLRTPRWERLDALSRARRLDGRETDEMVALYQSVATDLSVLRSSMPDPTLVNQLSTTLGRTRSRLTGAHTPAWAMVARFAVVSAPAALYRIRWWIVAVTGVSVAIAAVAGWWVWHDPGALSTLGTDSERREYVEHSFVQYYETNGAFASRVWTNNAWLAAQCVAFGITGLWPAWVLFQNALNVGVIGGMMASYGRLGEFFSYILPHGMLELTAVFTAGAAGLKIFWTVVDPGPRPRGRAVAEEGRALMTVALALVGVLGVSGLVEGFVTGSALPTAVQIGIGVVVLAAFWAYVLVLGRRAAQAGATGDLDPDEAGDVLPVAG
ncbi:stage II sporulation protein M [Luteimicrobium subarcticum]|uniref:Putative membrane protein SpoIIM required for sporulation n=1 Tax=Luteimicrobium subarcticum TaxID=620910 RepID=A0A2M8WTL2_9MICO|nr:stage II sporulation protein M [Luteimicrobium subarcticum]PJI94280.1 putative membrane protein SpoIIM required for sporulation [Luteimicrobium subarcticum]